MQPASSDCEAQDRAGRWARCYPRSRTRGSTPPWAAPPRVHLGADSGDRHPASLRRYSYRPNCVSVRPNVLEQLFYRRVATEHLVTELFGMLQFGLWWGTKTMSAYRTDPR